MVQKMLRTTDTGENESNSGDSFGKMIPPCTLDTRRKAQDGCWK